MPKRDSSRTKARVTSSFLVFVIVLLLLASGVTITFIYQSIYVSNSKIYGVITITDIYGNTQVYGSNSQPLADIGVGPSLLYDPSQPSKSGSINADISISLQLQQGLTPEAWNVQCGLEVIFDTQVVGRTPCSHSGTGNIPQGISLGTIQLSGESVWEDLQSSQGMHTIYFATTGGNITTSFAQGCSNPPCEVVTSWNATVVDTLNVTYANNAYTLTFTSSPASFPILVKPS